MKKYIKPELDCTLFEMLDDIAENSKPSSVISDNEHQHGTVSAGMTFDIALDSDNEF